MATAGRPRRSPTCWTCSPRPYRTIWHGPSRGSARSGRWRTVSENTNDRSFDRDDRLGAAILLLVEGGIRPITFEEIDRREPSNHARRRWERPTWPTWGRRPVGAAAAVAVAIAVVLVAVVVG